MSDSVAIFGLEPKSMQSYPYVKRAACVIEPLPFFWHGEILVDLPAHLISKSTNSPKGLHRPSELSPEMFVLQELVYRKYVMISNVSAFRSTTFDGADRAVLAHEMLDLAEREDLPARERIAMAGRLIERASRVPGRVTFYGN